MNCYSKHQGKKRNKKVRSDNKQWMKDRNIEEQILQKRQ